MFNIAENEKNILEFWKENDIFNKSVKKDNPSGDFSFYDGPPFATGLPHYGHVVASVLKDLIPRFKTMHGYRVERRWGWDCHGLPIENLIEKELGFKTKKDIEDFGIENFNNACKNSVLRYADEWKKFIPRIGRWVDMENDYKTMNPDFMESIWWVFKDLWDKKLVYEGYKAMHVCPRCETTLSNFEVTQGYKDISDLSATVKFKIKNFDVLDASNVYILAWTTTPWTLPGNVALAVNKDIDYVKIKIEPIAKSQEIDNSQIGYFILAKDRVEEVMKDKEYEILEEFKGEKLIGLEYEPIFDYYYKKEDLKHKENGWKVYHGDFVTTEEGTGIVHIAPAFGEDDMSLGKKNNLPFVQHVKMNGHFTDIVTDFKDKEVKLKDDPSKTDLEIVKFLIEKNKLFSKQKYTHSYPHCWRCDTPLLNYATSSWFVNVPEIKQNLMDNNNQIHWVPDHIKTGRFGKWLENSRDWAVSRSRFWGTPLPVWRCKDCGELKVVGGVEELQNQLQKIGNNRITKLTILRHGQSEKNVKNIDWSKDEEYPLTEKGRNDIEKISTELDNDFDLILCSPVLRARQTAEIINKKLNKEIIRVEELREVDHGNWEGENITDEIKQDIKFYKTLKGEERYNFKKGKTGESFADIELKIQKFINTVDQYKGKKILIVTHYGIKLMIEKILKNWDLEKYFMIDLEKYGYSTVFMDNTTKKEFDLHKQIVDKIEFNCEKCSSTMQRVPEVFDCWFESGSMPYSSFHYPFENEEKFKKMFPAEYIAEGQDQTRGWFYTLMVLSTALFNKPAFKNVIVNGIVLAEDGQKMSKKLKNYPDPGLMLEKYGADALRYYLMSSPVVNAQDLNFSEKGVDDVVKKVILKIVNVLEFYKMANQESGIRNQESGGDLEIIKNGFNNLDKWIISKLNKLNKEVEENYNNYYLAEGTRLIEIFIDDLSNWYLRRSRVRLKSEDESMRRPALICLRHVLLEFSKIIAPCMPFIAEYVYETVKYSDSSESVHLEKWPEYDQKKVNESLINDMDLIKNVVSLGLFIRKQKNIPVKQPLSLLKIVVNDKQDEIIYNSDIIREELNVKDIEFFSNVTQIADIVVKPNARILGPKFGEDVQEIIKQAKFGNFVVEGDYIIIADREDWKLSKEECELAYVCKQADSSTYETSSYNGIVAALNLEITEDLKFEGYAREIISYINKLRSEKNLSIKDKIDVLYNTESEEIKKAINSNIEKIKELTLSKNFQEADISINELRLDNYSVYLDIE